MLRSAALVKVEPSRQTAETTNNMQPFLGRPEMGHQCLTLAYDPNVYIYTYRCVFNDLSTILPYIYNNSIYICTVHTHIYIYIYIYIYICKLYIYDTVLVHITI